MKDKASVVFWCACDPYAEMDLKAMIAHIRDVHGEEVEGKPMQSEMECHVDGLDWYSTTHRLTTGGGNVFFRRVVCGR